MRRSIVYSPPAMSDFSGPAAPSAPIEPGGLAVVAFSGGLDTSFCVCWLRRQAGLLAGLAERRAEDQA